MTFNPERLFFIGFKSSSFPNLPGRVPRFHYEQEKEERMLGRTTVHGQLKEKKIYAGREISEKICFQFRRGLQIPRTPELIEFCLHAVEKKFLDPKNQLANNEGSKTRSASKLRQKLELRATDEPLAIM